MDKVYIVIWDDFSICLKSASKHLVIGMVSQYHHGGSRPSTHVDLWHWACHIKNQASGAAVPKFRNRSMMIRNYDNYMIISDYNYAKNSYDML